MSRIEESRRPFLVHRIRHIPRSFSWIDRDLLHRGFLRRLRSEEILLYFFLALVSGPEGTSFWSHRRIGEFLGLSEHEVLDALRGLIDHDLVAFRYPTFQVLSLPGKGAER